MPNITGTIQDATGAAAQDVLVRLSPAPASPGEAEVSVSGVGVLSRSVDVRTGGDGSFTVAAIAGIRYRLTIAEIGYDRVFVCPASNVNFTLLGLRPSVETAAASVDTNGATNVTVTVQVAALATVMERYDSLVIQRSTAGVGGPWAAVDTLDLEHRQTFYAVTDAGVTTPVHYRAYYLKTGAGDVSEYSDEILADADTDLLIMGVEELKELYLFGVNLTDDAGTPYPDRLFKHYIKAAVATLEAELGRDIVAREIVGETHDHYAMDYARWGNFRLHHYPVIEVKRVAFQYPNASVASEISLDWVVLHEDGRHGIIELVPGQGNIADVLYVPGALMPLWSGNTGRVPGIWRFNYRAGYEPGEIPSDLKHAIGMMAAIGPFNIAGDLIAGAGIASKSISIPGLSQSVGTTSSATNSGYGARIGEYQKELKELLPALRARYGTSLRMEVA